MKLALNRIFPTLLLLVLIGGLFLLLVSPTDAKHGPPCCYTDNPEGECGSNASVCDLYFQWDFQCRYGCQPSLPYCLESELGVPALGGFEPGGITFFIWFTWAGLAFAAILALAFIVIGGIRYVASAGNASQQGAAKETIRNAVLGLILAMAASLILYTINPSLTEINIDSVALPAGSIGVPDPVCTAGSTPPTCADIQAGNAPSSCPTPDEVAAMNSM